MNTTPEEADRESFLQMLYRCEERKDIPVVDEVFVQRFSSLSEEDQYKAISHIKFIRQYPHGEDIQREVYQGRLQGLCKAWFEDQTENWVSYNYEAPIDKQYWEKEEAISLERQAKRKVQMEALGMIEPVEEGTQETVSLEEAKEALGLV